MRSAHRAGGGGSTRCWLARSIPWSARPGSTRPGWWSRRGPPPRSCGRPADRWAWCGRGHRPRPEAGPGPPHPTQPHRPRPEAGPGPPHPTQPHRSRPHTGSRAPDRTTRYLSQLDEHGEAAMTSHTAPDAAGATGSDPAAAATTRTPDARAATTRRRRTVRTVVAGLALVVLTVPGVLAAAGV